MTGLPLGTIASYAADPKNLPKNWLLCDGASKSTSQYKQLHDMIGYSNGGADTVFQLPDLQGRFLRGADDRAPPGTSRAHQTKQNPGDSEIRVQLQHVATGHNYSTKAAGAESMIKWKEGTTTFNVHQDTVDADGNKIFIETRPINTYLHYIIKAAPADPNVADQEDDLPVGSIIPWGGSESNKPDFPAYICCDGSKAALEEKEDDSVKGLQKLVGTVFDPRPPSTRGTGVFYAPDLSGHFIRGVDLASQVDKDKTTRKPSAGGATVDIGGGIGTWQEYDTAFSNPKVDIPHFSTSSGDCPRIHGNESIHDDDYKEDIVWVAKNGLLPRETRPSNAACFFYISSRPKGRKFPIGGIIAIPGKGTPDPTRWIRCNGQMLTLGDDTRPLFNVLGGTWGAGADSAGNIIFGLPKLQSNFLRGADVAKVQREAGDPDRDRRTAWDGKPKKGPGSYQAYATALPQHRKLTLWTQTPKEEDSKPCSYPTSEFATPSNCTSIGTHDIAAWKNSGNQSFPLKWDGDQGEETAPAFVSAHFYICCA